MKQIKLKDIQIIANKTMWDVCQIGVELANDFSENEEEYNKIWVLTQEIFEVDMMSEGYYSYSPKEKFKIIFLKNLLEALNSEQLNNQEVIGDK